MTAEHLRLDEAREQTMPWKQWGPYFSDASGAQCVRTIAKAVTPGTISATTRPAPARIGGGKTESPGSLIRSKGFASPCALERQGPDSQGAPLRLDEQRKVTTARTSRNTTSTWTARRPTRT